MGHRRAVSQLVKCSSFRDVMTVVDTRRIKDLEVESIFCWKWISSTTFSGSSHCMHVHLDSGFNSL